MEETITREKHEKMEEEMSINVLPLKSFIIETNFSMPSEDENFSMPSEGEKGFSLRSIMCNDQ